MNQYGNLTAHLDRLARTLQNKSTYANNADNALRSGIQFIQATDQKLLLNSLALRLLSETTLSDPSAVKEVSIAMYNQHMTNLPGTKVRDTAHWKPEETEEAISWCKDNLQTPARGLSSLGGGRFPDIEEMTCGLTVGEVLEIAVLIDTHHADENASVKGLLQSFAERKFKQACEKPDDASKTSSRE